MSMAATAIAATALFPFGFCYVFFFFSFFLLFALAVALLCLNATGNDETYANIDDFFCCFGFRRLGRCRHKLKLMWEIRVSYIFYFSAMLVVDDLDIAIGIW